MLVSLTQKKRLQHQHDGTGDEADVCKIEDRILKRSELEKEEISDGVNDLSIYVFIPMPTEPVVKISERSPHNESQADGQPFTPSRSPHKQPVEHSANRDDAQRSKQPRFPLADSPQRNHG